MNLHTESNQITEQEYPEPDETVVCLEDVSVRYRVPEERFGTFKEYMIRRIQGRVAERDFWAMHNVHLQVKKGEVFGVVGRNGAGKSTMLKVISRVLRPTKGRVWIKGRLSPLLGLGAAFHAELSGRENVFLNAALLGHTQNEVEDKFQQIMEFADIGDFIDAPLRTFSTGMVARLGFAVATAWEPDILLLDEVLAVGDEAFQAKCHERIKFFRENGTTVILVSHNTQVIRSICQRAAWIDQGVIQVIGSADDVVARYKGG
jgi:ABC-type polysaccharide/polyol phosphate transport system ATPase subunit